jgi:hypothetical protein
MLYLIFSYLLISCVCLVCGMLVYGFIRKAKPAQTHIIHFLVTGLISLTALGQWIVLILPLSRFVVLLFFMIVLILCTVMRKFLFERFRECRTEIIKRGPVFYFCLISLVFMILILNAGPFRMDDTDSYHIQMVKWIQEFGSVPGIANLHLRFGFNSSWFVSIAMLNYPVKGLNNFGSLNGVLSLWLCYYLLQKLFDTTEKKSDTGGGLPIACFILLIFCLLDWPMIRGSAASTNYDFISTCCIIILFVDFFFYGKQITVEWFIWPLYLFTVRMMNFPLLFLSIGYIYTNRRNWSAVKMLMIFVASGFLIIPFLIRNTILSGYPFYPVYQLDLFSMDWKADKLNLVEISRYIRYYNRVNPGFQSLAVTEKLGFPDWILNWYKYLFQFDRLIFTLSVFGYFILLLNIKKIKTYASRIFIFTMICQLISWFFIAPDPRFVYGPLLFGIFAVLAELIPHRGSWIRLVKYSVTFTGSLILIYSVSKLVQDREYRNYFVPHRLPVPEIHTIVVNNIQLHIPEKVLNNWNPRCYDIELPCLYKPDNRLEARGTKIADGFRLNYGKSDSDGEYKITE